MMGQYWLAKTKLKLWPKYFQKVVMEFLKNHLTEFSTDWLTKLTHCLMPSDSHNSTMAKAMGLTFLLFNITSAQEVPFAIPLYIQCILHGLTRFVSLCLSQKSVNFVVGTWWLPFVMEIICNLLWLQKFFLNSCWFILLYNGLNIAGNKASCFQMIIDITGACSAVVFDLVCVGSLVIIKLCRYIVFQS